MKTLSASRHHIHNLQDCIDLVRQLGFEVGRSKDDKGYCYAEAVGNQRCFVSLNKRSGLLTVDCPQTNVIR